MAIALKHFRQRLETALADYLDIQKALGTDVVQASQILAAAEASGNTPLPLCNIGCPSARLVDGTAAIWNCEVNLSVETAIDADERDDHDERVAWLETQLLDIANLIAGMNLMEGVTAQSCYINGYESEPHDKRHIDVVNLIVTAHPF